MEDLLACQFGSALGDRGLVVRVLALLLVAQLLEMELVLVAAATPVRLFGTRCLLTGLFLEAEVGTSWFISSSPPFSMMLSTKDVAHG